MPMQLWAVCMCTRVHLCSFVACNNFFIFRYFFHSLFFLHMRFTTGCSVLVGTIFVMLFIRLSKNTFFPLLSTYIVLVFFPFISIKVPFRPLVVDVYLFQLIFFAWLFHMATCCGVLLCPCAFSHKCDFLPIWKLMGELTKKFHWNV